MIKCKEDLIGCYVDGSDKDLAKAFQEALFSFGVKWLLFCDQTVRIPTDSYKYICFNGDEISWNTRAYTEENYKRKLALSDLKPKRTRTEYEKVTESIFDLRDEFERGELYRDSSGFRKIETLAHLGACCQNGNIFKKVEKEIDWKFLLREAIEKSSGRNIGDGSVMVGTSDLTDEEFLLLCHEISEVTDKPRRPSC